MPRSASGSADGLRILMVAARYLPFKGGTETHVHEVGSRLAAAGHTITVLTGNPGGVLAGEEQIDGVRVLRKRAFPAGRDWCLAPGILASVGGAEGVDCDIVHVQGYHTFAAPFAMLAALRRQIPYVVTFHSGGHSSVARLALRTTQAAVIAPLVARAARLIGVSEFEADHFSRAMRIPRERFAVIPNGAQLPLPDPSAKPDPQSPLLISLGRLERYKGHHRALEAFVHLRSRVPGARLRLVGDGPYESTLRTLTARLGISESVQIGAVPAGDRAAMANLLARASLVLLLSDYEAHPVAVMEALSLGRPVLTCDTAGCRELAQRGLVSAVPLDAPAAFVAAAMQAEMERASVPPLRLPNWDVCAARLLTVYRDVAGRRRDVFKGRLVGAGATP